MSPATPVGQSAGDRSLVRLEERQEPAGLGQGRRCAAFAFKLDDEFLGHRGEGVRRADGGRHGGALLFGGGVLAGCEHLTGLVTTLAGLFQADFGVAADGQLLLLVPEAIAKSPQLAARWPDDEEQAAFVENFVLTCPRLSGSNRRVGERHQGSLSAAPTE